VHLYRLPARAAS